MTGLVNGALSPRLRKQAGVATGGWVGIYLGMPRSRAPPSPGVCRVHPVDAAAEARPGAERTHPKNPRSRCMCAERRKYAAPAVPGNSRTEDPKKRLGLLQTRLGGIR